jgi:hypothetical protein
VAVVIICMFRQYTCELLDSRCRDLIAAKWMREKEQNRRSPLRFASVGSPDEGFHSLALLHAKHNFGRGFAPSCSTHVVPRPCRRKHPEFPASCPGLGRVCAILYGKAHKVCGTHWTQQKFGAMGHPSRGTEMVQDPWLQSRERHRWCFSDNRSAAILMTVDGNGGR